MNFISIIIPTFNEEKYITKCLEKWFNQDYPKENYEILIFDGKSTDKTVELIKELQKKHNFENIKIYTNEKRKQVYAFNEGIKNANGDFFIIFGAHAYPEHDFLKNNVETYQKIKNEETKLVGVGGIINKISENMSAEVAKVIYSTPLSGGSSFWYAKEGFFSNTVVYGMYDTKMIKESGILFDTDFITGQDFEFNLHLIKEGFKLYTNPNIVSHYHTRSTVKKFIKQTISYGAAKGLMIRKGYFNILWLFPFGFLFMILSMIITGLFIFIYIIAVLIDTIRLLVKTREPLYVALPILLFLFHCLISYGFFKGLIKGNSTFK
ncbi:glycosyltransferase involved in cell wall biosynthesis [Methanococcus voltae]|uniref:glycosyltransferase n=1 Tax=Methanococcus voltae TaxID=2188 RepID=UPI001AE538C2|nr:glycosyltransferase [Methanococcus voltae]MBP2144269.1 glycosyltransferase involved in cell wall biosynthesis [Methanococcus voltae]